MIGDVEEMIDGSYPRCDPTTGSLVVLDLIPVMMFVIEFNGEICTFEKDKVPNVVANFKPHSIFQISSGNVPIPPSSNWHSSLEVFM